MTAQAIGPIIQSFFVDYLRVIKGLRPASVKSYRDTLRLFLQFVSVEAGHKITRLLLEDLSFEKVKGFLRYIEEKRGNHIRTRNQRLAALHTFFEYIASRIPEMLSVSEQVSAVPTKRVPPPETCFLEREEMTSLFAHLPTKGKHALRDRVLLLFLYNTGARVQEVSDLRVGNLDFESQPRVRLHGKGDKWRTCPLWAETTQQLQLLLKEGIIKSVAESPVFVSTNNQPLTRFGIYKIVRRHTAHLQPKRLNAHPRHISPHVFRHTAAVNLLESGVEVNVIRSWLGHVSLETTNRYAEINIRTKEAALRNCEPSSDSLGGSLQKPVWRNDETLLTWLDSL